MMTYSELFALLDDAGYELRQELNEYGDGGQLPFAEYWIRAQPLRQIIVYRAARDDESCAVFVRLDGSEIERRITE